MTYNYVDAMPANMAIDVTTGMLEPIQMAQMPLRNDVKFIDVAQSATKSFTPTRNIKRVNSGEVEVGGDKEAWLTKIFTQYPLLTNNALDSIAEKYQKYSNAPELLEKELEKVYPPLKPGIPINPNATKNATADMPSPSTPQDEPKSNTTKMLLIGGAVLAVAGISYLLLRKKGKAKANLNGVAKTKKTSRKPSGKSAKRSTKKSYHKVVTI